FGAAVYLAMGHVLRARVESGMRMESVEVEYEVARTGDRSLVGVALGRRFARHPAYDVQVSTPGGEPLFRSDRIRDEGLPRPSSFDVLRDNNEGFRRGRAGRFRLLSRSVPGPGGPLVLQVAVASEGNDRELGELLAALLIAGPLALALALGVGYLLARKALAPVERMAAEADQITATRLDRRLDAPNPDDELGRLAATLNGMIARLERSFDEIRRFTADAAHELRTPLAVMRNAAEVALRSPRDPGHYRRVLCDVLEEVERLTRLAEQLLFLCREDAGLVPLASGEVRLDDVVRETAEHMGAVAESKGVALACDGLAPATVRGDEDQIRRLLFNLLDNAIKLTPAGGAVVVRLRSLGGVARTEIADTGVGIPAEHLPHVLERFYRVDPARGREAEGVGLGLAICRSIAEAHGGAIWVESTVGRGTSAILSLPACTAEADSGRDLDIAAAEPDGRTQGLTR
ncbi:MAG TPA: ATP-binding protein, partial [Isosphaeraceae bacterium]